MSRVLAATGWKSNADLIEVVAGLGLLRKHDHILDPTAGSMTWWKKWRPDDLVALSRRAGGDHDFRHLDFPDDYFDAIAYDPPYVSIGGRTKTGMGEMHERFGMTDAPRSPARVQALINDGLTEMWRLVKPSAVKRLDPVRPNGIVLVKCQNYVSSGEYFPGVFYTYKHAMRLGFTLWDQFEHISGPSAQPTTNRDGSPRRQVHAHRNNSTLLVLRKPRRPVSEREIADAKRDLAAVAQVPVR